MFTSTEGGASVVIERTRSSAKIEWKTYLMGPILYNEGIKILLLMGSVVNQLKAAIAILRPPILVVGPLRLST